MKVTGARELRENLRGVLASDEPVLVTRHGKVAGVYVPLHDPNTIPDDVRNEVLRALSLHISRQLEAAGVTEEELQEDFDAHRRRRRRR